MNIPEALRNERRWIVWRHLDGRKPPVTEDGTPDKAWNDSSTWLSFDEAVALMESSPNVDGVGFVLGNGWSGLDLDKCRKVGTGEIDPRAEAVLETIPDAYYEISPSGEGLKVFGRGEGWLELTFFDGHVRVDHKNSGYFAVTGNGEPGSALVELPLDGIATHFGAVAPTEQKKSKRVLGAVIPPGAQNVELFKEACSQARLGKSENEIFALLRAIADERCPIEEGREPWSDTAIRTIARSAARYAPAEDPFQLSDSGNGEFFAKIHEGLVAFNHRTGKWLIYDGTRWKPDKVEHIRNLAREAMRTRQQSWIRNTDADPDLRKRAIQHAVKSESTVAINHLLTEARSNQALATNGAEWDTDPWLLGVTNGVVDLRTGALRFAKPEDRITMQTSVAFDPEAECPVWEATVKDVFKDNPELVPYIQRAFGYSLTGDCREEIFFLLVGNGRNGKGTLVNTFSAILGDYSDNLNFASLTASKHGQAAGAASPDLAKLAHCRFVTASEANEGDRLSEQRIKGMTGRDTITARFLYGEEFDYIPEFKLWLSVNHLPRVTDDSEGFWSRPHQVPFEQCYKGREDKDLKDKLINEAEGILAWAVRGCLEWQKNGLDAPKVCTKAKEVYRLSQEPLAQFYEDECVFDPKARVSVGELFNHYNDWFDRNRFHWKRLGRRHFSKEVGKRVGEPQRRGGTYTFIGLGLAHHGEEHDGQGDL